MVHLSRPSRHGGNSSGLPKRLVGSMHQASPANELGTNFHQEQRQTLPLPHRPKRLRLRLRTHQRQKRRLWHLQNHPPRRKRRSQPRPRNRSPRQKGRLVRPNRRRLRHLSLDQQRLRLERRPQTGRATLPLRMRRVLAVHRHAGGHGRVLQR